MTASLALPLIADESNPTTLESQADLYPKTRSLWLRLVKKNVAVSELCGLSWKELTPRPENVTG